MSILEQKEVSWQDFATIKRWKTRLTINAHNQELPEKTWKVACSWMPQFLKLTGKTPDELIAEAKIDSDIGEERVAEFFIHLKKRLPNNSAKNGAHGYIRGFYKHNKINTKSWHNPKSTVPLVKKIDDKYPMFTLNEDTQKFDLNRKLLREFLRHLSIRDETFALCLISTGQDSGDILKLSVGFVTSQEGDRLFLNDNRRKTGEEIKVFFSREATKKLREYVKKERSDAEDDDPLFVTSTIERRRIFALEHERPYVQGDILPNGARLQPRTLSVSFRIVEDKLGIKMTKGQQSPLRPKRLRHVFRSACNYAGIVDDMVRVFLGQAGMSSKIYLGKSKQELEFFYKLVEPKITIYDNEPVVEEIHKLKKEMAKYKEHWEENKTLREEFRDLKNKHEGQMTDLWNMYRKITSPESLRKPLFGSNRETKK